MSCDQTPFVRSKVYLTGHWYCLIVKCPLTDRYNPHCFQHFHRRVMKAGIETGNKMKQNREKLTVK